MWPTERVSLFRVYLKYINEGLTLSFQIPDTSGKIGIPISLTLLSIAWSPMMRKFQIQSNVDQNNQTRNGERSGREKSVVQGPTMTRKTAQGKAAIVSSLWNLTLTPLVAAVFAKTFHIIELDNVTSGFKAINASNPSFVFFMVLVFASFFAYHFGWLACSLCMQQIGYALPLTLATPIAVLITHVSRFCETNTIPLPCVSTDLDYSLLAGALLWLAQFFATTFYVWKSQGLVMGKALDLLWIPSYSGMCLLLTSCTKQASCLLVQIV